MNQLVALQRHLRGKSTALVTHMYEHRGFESHLRQLTFCLVSVISCSASKYYVHIIMAFLLGSGLWVETGVAKCVGLLGNHHSCRITGVCWCLVHQSKRKVSQLSARLVVGSLLPHTGQTIATLVMLPKSPDTQSLTSALLTAQLISLKDFSCLRRARVYSHNTNSSASTYPPLPTTGMYISMVM